MIWNQSNPMMTPLLSTVKSSVDAIGVRNVMSLTNVKSLTNSKYHPHPLINTRKSVVHESFLLTNIKKPVTARAREREREKMCKCKYLKNKINHRFSNLIRIPTILSVLVQEKF
mmetsp:Transcript_24489/g.50037  ORF Transcript_24489/g.50037 Transcript_24489/m.50037 type:complete len:114 (-) Transcript_24489:20-361(-)